MRRLCLTRGCTELTTTTRCSFHAREHERARGRARGTSTSQGYDGAHKRAKAALRGMLPLPCGYCGSTITQAQRWDAAHVVDGAPEYGYVAAHPACNQRAKRGGRVAT